MVVVGMKMSYDQNKGLPSVTFFSCYYSSHAFPFDVCFKLWFFLESLEHCLVYFSLQEKTGDDVPMPTYFRFLALLAFKIFSAEQVNSSNSFSIGCYLIVDDTVPCQFVIFLSLHRSYQSWHPRVPCLLPTGLVQRNRTFICLREEIYILGKCLTWSI